MGKSGLMKRNAVFSRRDFGSSIIDIVEKEVDEEVFPGKSEVVRSYGRHHLKRFLDLIELIPRVNETRILDIGIAYGFYDIALKDNYDIAVEGIELPDNASSFCGMLETHDIPVKQCDLAKQKLPYEDETFDVVIFSEVIEHLRVHPVLPLRDIRRVLKAEGCLVLTTPNVARLTNVLALLFGKNVFEDFKRELQPQGHITDSWTHIREYTLEELKSLIYLSGLKVDKVKMSRCWNGFQRANIGSNSRLRRLCALVDSAVTLFLPKYRACIMIRATKQRTF